MKPAKSYIVRYWTDGRVQEEICIQYSTALELIMHIIADQRVLKMEVEINND